MGLIQNLQGQQPQQQAGNDDAMHASMMEMLGATLLGDGGQAVAGRLQAGEDPGKGGGIFMLFHDRYCPLKVVLCQDPIPILQEALTHTAEGLRGERGMALLQFRQALAI